MKCSRHFGGQGRFVGPDIPARLRGGRHKHGAELVELGGSWAVPSRRRIRTGDPVQPILCRIKRDHYHRYLNGLLGEPWYEVLRVDLVDAETRLIDGRLPPDLLPPVLPVHLANVLGHVLEYEAVHPRCCCASDSVVLGRTEAPRPRAETSKPTRRRRSPAPTCRSPCARGPQAFYY
jgi:hypothetical protein